MNFVGLDLAWGSLDLDKKPKPTGIAALDADGELLSVQAAVFDDEVRAVLNPYVGGPCVVAIDAPLLVTNQTGRRKAEADLGNDFGKFDAGAHSANIERFGTDPRGARLTRIMGLNIDPHSTSPRRAIEVFPHPATVALFKRGRIFKIKSGRPEQRKPQLLEYMAAIENLATASVPMYTADNDDWNRLRNDVEQATRQYELDRAEDPIDAVMCAYIALYAEHRPEDITIYGDYPANGYILTPTLPLGLHPSPRPPRNATVTGAATDSVSPEVAAELARCSSRASQLSAAYATVEKQVFELHQNQTGEATQRIADLLKRAEAALAHAEQQMTAICDELRPPR